MNNLTGIGLRWDPTGHIGLSGPLLALADDCDLAFRLLAGRWRATEERYPAALPATALVSHLRSFPQQVTFPITLDPGGANLDEFADGQIVDAGGQVALTRTAPVRNVLTPAACYHLYFAHRGERLSGPQYLTTRNTCFRREESYQPLRRQWSFSMREIVCLGTPSETAEFLDVARDMTERFAALIEVPLRWSTATDPFFRPHSDPGSLMQRVQPLKHEAVYGATLALASANQHHDHFGQAFGIERDGVPAASACLAFGIERWLYAVTERHGTEPAGWPDLTAAASASAAPHDPGICQANHEILAHSDVDCQANPGIMARPDVDCQATSGILGGGRDGHRAGGGDA